MQTPPPDFTMALRGYDPSQVDALAQQAVQALESSDQRLRSAIREALHQPTLRVRMRGYDREQVDYYLDHVARLLA